MTLTERKRCDECKRAGGSLLSVFLKENQALDLEEECLSCGWRDGENYHQNQIRDVGFDQAKQEWEENRDSDLSKEIVKELDFHEKAQWEKCKEKIDKLFAPKTYTERKYCDQCQEETVHLKENEEKEIEEECLPCGWKDHVEYWKGERERDGIDYTKTRWEEVRDSELNQKVLLELTPQEKTQWDELVEETDKLFVPEKKKNEEKQNSSFQQYLPYIIGGVGIVAVIGLIIVLATNNRRR